MSGISTKAMSMEKKLIIFVLLAVAASASVIPPLGTAIEAIREALPVESAVTQSTNQVIQDTAEEGSTSETETPTPSALSSEGSFATEVSESTTDGSSNGKGDDDGGITGGDIAAIVVGFLFLLSFAVGGLYFMRSEALGCFAKK